MVHSCTLASTRSAMVYRCMLNLKAKSLSYSSGFSFTRFVPGGFNVGLIGSTCTALPWRRARPGTARCVVAKEGH